MREMSGQTLTPYIYIADSYWASAFSKAGFKGDCLRKSINRCVCFRTTASFNSFFKAVF